MDPELYLRILMAALCGILIGYERESRNKEAGIRTHAMVALGSSLITVVSIYGFSGDNSRIAAQIVSGIGFLGAGIIFVKDRNVSGLTTAAGLWATAGIGIAFGAELYDIGIISTLMIVLIQYILHKNFIIKRTYKNRSIEIVFNSDNLNILKSIEKELNIEITIETFEKKNNETYRMRGIISSKTDFDTNTIIKKLIKDACVVSVKIS